MKLDQAYNYTVVVQVPLPDLQLNLNFGAMFNLPSLLIPHIPAGVQWLIENASTVFQSAVEIATTLIRAIPEITVTVLIKVGSITVLNVQLVAEKVPFDVPLPVFILALPNLAVNLNFDLAALIPVPPPVVIRVPIPVPRVTMPALAITGGNVSAAVGASAAVLTETSDSPILPTAISNPVLLPVL